MYVRIHLKFITIFQGHLSILQIQMSTLTDHGLNGLFGCGKEWICNIIYISYT